MGVTDSVLLTIAIPCSVRARALGVTREPIVRDRLPRSSVRNELAQYWSNARISVESPESDANTVRFDRVAAVCRRSATAAEPLLPTVVRPPCTQLVLARGDLERRRLDAGGHRSTGSGATLAARAMAIESRPQLGPDLEANGAATAAASKWKPRFAHRQIIRHRGSRSISRVTDASPVAMAILRPRRCGRPPLIHSRALC